MRNRKILTWAAIAFAAFYLFTRPAAAAGAVKGAFGQIMHGAHQVGVFVTNVIS